LRRLKTFSLIGKASKSLHQRNTAMTDHIQNSDIGDAVQKISDGACDMQSAVASQANSACEKAQYETVTAIQTNPFQSMLIAMGVGIVVGALVSRR